MVDFNNSNSSNIVPEKKPILHAPAGSSSVTDDDTTKTCFEKIQPLLNFLDLETYLMPANSENPYEQMLVSVGNDDDELDEKDEEEYLKTHPIFQLIFMDDFLKNNKVEELNKKSYSYILQFFTILPIKVNEDRYMEIHYLLSVVSRILPLGIIALDNNGEIFFKYSLITEGRNVDGGLVAEIITMITFLVNKFSGHINAFATGQIDVKNAIEDLEQELLKNNENLALV